MSPPTEPARPVATATLDRIDEVDLRRFGSPLAVWEDTPLEDLRTAWRLPAVVAFARTTSTNDVARMLAEAGAPAGTAVLADEQTAGRGRAGRPWISPAGSSLLLSLVLRPEIASASAAPAAVTPLRLGLAVARAVERVASRPAEIKWPNDVLVDGRKLAGILCESAVGGPGGTFIIAGIGINIRQRPEDFPADFRESTTSLDMVAAEPPGRATIAAALFEELLPCTVWSEDRLDSESLDEIGRRDALFGMPVDVDGKPAGIACGIEVDGALMVRTSTGGRIRIHNGTVRVRYRGSPRPS